MLTVVDKNSKQGRQKNALGNEVTGAGVWESFPTHTGAKDLCYLKSTISHLQTQVKMSDMMCIL